MFMNNENIIGLLNPGIIRRVRTRHGELMSRGPSFDARMITEPALPVVTLALNNIAPHSTRIRRSA